MRKILVVEDDPNLLALLNHHFKHELNISFIYVSSYQEAIDMFKRDDFELYIVDINLGEHSGFELISYLNNYKDICDRTIVISFDDNILNQIKAYDLGVSNFIAKPLNFDLLRAILKKNLRRIEQQGQQSIDFSNYTIIPNNRSCIKHMGSRNREIPLTHIEFNIILRLSTSKNMVVAKEELSYLGKDSKHPMSFKALEMHIKNLRKKLGNNIIHTRRGVGYFIKS